MHCRVRQRMCDNVQSQASQVVSTAQTLHTAAYVRRSEGIASRYFYARYHVNCNTGLLHNIGDRSSCLALWHHDGSAICDFA